MHSAPRFLSFTKVFALALVATLGLTACQTSGGRADDPNLTPAQRQLRQETARFNQTVGEGAVIGAVAGGLIGALAYSDNPLAGAAIGAAAGGALGAGAGYFVATQNESYATEEDRLEAEIAAARQEVASYQRIVSSAQAVVDQHKARIAQLNGQLRQGQITASQYRTQTASMEADLQEIRTAIDGNRETAQALQQRIAEQRAAGGAGAAELTQAHQELVAERRELERLANELGDAMSEPAPSATS
jgi:hypothetical protein